MKASRAYLAVVGTLIGAVCLSNLISLSGYFRAVENGGGGISEKRLSDRLQYLHTQLKGVNDPGEAKRQLRSFEAVLGQAAGGPLLEKLRKIYVPVQAAFDSKPKEAETRFPLVKKRELMEGLVNAYRKEVPNGPIPVRAAYLNILFDTQNSLLNEGEETEQVYLRRNRDRFDTLKNLAARTGSAGLIARVSNLDSIFQAYEHGFEKSRDWRKSVTDTLAVAEKSLPTLSREALGSKDYEAESQRRSFLYASVIALAVSVLAFVVLYLCHKMLKLRFYTRSDAFQRILREFGRERSDPSLEKDLALLQQDPDWADLAHGFVESESEFVAKHQALLAVPRALQAPYILFSKDRVAKHWSPAAAGIFEVEGKEPPAFDEIIHTDWIASREESVPLVEMIRNSFSASKEDVFELMLKGEQPYELLSYPVVSGPLAGGKLYLFRSIRSETSRIDAAVSRQLERVRTFIHKVTHRYPVEIAAAEGDTEEVHNALEDLATMKAKIDERELLWKSETEALLDQVERQKEVLGRLSMEVRQIRDAHGGALELVGMMQVGDEDWHEEICLLEKEISHWASLRERLETGLSRQEEVLSRARSFEGRMRLSAEEIEGFLSAYETTLEELKVFAGEAKLQAVNLAFAKDSRDFSARCRTYAQELSSFVSSAHLLAERVKAFMAEHPATTLAPILSGAESDPAIVAGLKKEEERLSLFIRRWKEEGSELVSGGEKALDLLRSADKKSAVVGQLGETSLLINDQAGNNLRRWN